jgi:DNA replication and repair protein RecF
VLVTGPNGAGKTNLLEALHVGTQGFSPRTRADAQLVRFGADGGRIHLRGANGLSRFEAEVSLSARETRRARFNGSVLRSAEQLRLELRTLVFTPDRLAVVKGAPATRRAFLDRSLSRLFPARASISAEYAAALGQRNAALRRVGVGASTRDALTPWTDAVVGLGRSLVESRRETLVALGAEYPSAAAELGLADATLEYVGEPTTLAEYEERLPRDVERGLTGAGPHLHDMRLAASGGRDLRTFGSQGEQRVAVLALVLAEARVLAERSGMPPLVLLDDVLSELDDQRRGALATLVSGGGQVVITATSPTAFPLDPAQLLVVSPGMARAA